MEKLPRRSSWGRRLCLALAFSSDPGGMCIRVRWMLCRLRGTLPNGFSEERTLPKIPNQNQKLPFHIICSVSCLVFLSSILNQKGCLGNIFFFAEVSLCIGKKRGEKRLFSSKQSASLSALTFPRAEGSPNTPGAGSGGPSSLGATRTDPGPIPAPHPLLSQPCSGALGSFCAFLQQLPGARGQEPLCGLDALFPLWNLLLLSQSAVPGGEEALAQ